MDNVKIYDHGNIQISKDFIYLYRTSIKLSTIESVNDFPLPKHPIFFLVKEWIQIFLFLVIICNIWTKIMWIGDLYLFTIFPLIIYNIKTHFTKYYGLNIRTISGQDHIVKSKDIYFIYKIQDTIRNAIKTQNENLIINLDNCTIDNKGIINIGNNNQNVVERKNKK